MSIRRRHAILVSYKSTSVCHPELSETGTYIIQVRANDFVSTGSYSLGLECLLPTSPVDATLACGGLISRTIGASAKVDQIIFNGQSSAQLTLGLTENGFPFGATATGTLFSPTGSP